MQAVFVESYLMGLVEGIRAIKSIVKTESFSNHIGYVKTEFFLEEE
jgi:hypothetical protein